MVGRIRRWVVMQYRFMRMMDAKESYSLALERAIVAQKHAQAAKDHIMEAKTRLSTAQAAYASAVATLRGVE